MFELNQEQQQIIQDTEGAKLVISGPGTGKTTTITHFLAKLLAKGLASPEQVLAVTFTVKAAREMREKVVKLTGKKPDVLTIHSFARQVLCAYPPPGFTSDYTITDEKYNWRLITRLLKRYKLDLHPQVVKEKLALARNTRDESYLDQKLAELYKAYMQEMRRNNAMDFDALLAWGVYTFENNQTALDYYRSKYRYLLIDEFQDTSQLQYAFLRPLVTENLLCVGDYDQSIYGFRGADVNLILNLEKDFSGLATYYLKENYRCTKRIVNAANALIINNRKRRPKPHLTNRPQGQPVVKQSCVDPNKEAEYIAREIIAHKKSGHSWTSFAVLYRNNYLSLPVEKVFTESKIPFRIIGDRDYFDLPEIRNVLCFLRLKSQPDNAEAQQDALSVLNNLRSPNPKNLLSSLMEALSDARDLVSLYSMIIEQTGLLTALKSDTSQPGQKALENVEALKEFLYDFQNKGLDRFLAFTEEARSSESKDAVNLLTIHKAKGLEFETVFVMGLDDRTIPYHQSTSREDIEEERRLLYVAITRAKDTLYLTYPRQRHSDKKKIRLRPSRFLREMKLDEEQTTPAVITGSTAGAMKSRPDYHAEAEASRKENPQGPWKDSSGNRWGICKHCSQFTRDWWSLDGDTNMCECNDCKYK